MDSIPEEPRIFSIPNYNMPVVEAKIAKLNKRGAKIGADPIVIKIVKHWENACDFGDNRVNIKVIPMTDIQVIGKAPKLAGWTLVSVVEPVGDQVLLRKFPGVDLEIPLEFRSVTPDRCDHCHSKRQRNETFIVAHDSGEWKVVGRNCLADFTGCSNPERIANYGEALCDLTISLEDDEKVSWGASGSGYYCAPTRSFLYMVAIVSGREGFISSSEAKRRNESHGEEDSYVTPTGKRVFYDFFHPDSSMTTSAAKAKRDFIASINDIEDEIANELVDGAMQWGKTQFVDASEEGLSDYGHNMKVLLASERVRIIDVGFVASVISGYKRSLKPKIERLMGKGHVGALGAKISVPVTVKRVYEYSGQYGLTYITTLQDDEGNLFTWFAPKDQKMTEGVYKVMTSKVKRHDERDGVKSTVVTYANFV